MSGINITPSPSPQPGSNEEAAAQGPDVELPRVQIGTDQLDYARILAKTFLDSAKILDTAEAVETDDGICLKSPSVRQAQLANAADLHWATKALTTSPLFNVTSERDAKRVLLLAADVKFYTVRDAFKTFLPLDKPITAERLSGLQSELHRIFQISKRLANEPVFQQLSKLDFNFAFNDDVVTLLKELGAPRNEIFGDGSDESAFTYYGESGFLDLGGAITEIEKDPELLFNEASRLAKNLQALLKVAPAQIVKHYYNYLISETLPLLLLPELTPEVLATMPGIAEHQTRILWGYGSVLDGVLDRLDPLLRAYHKIADGKGFDTLMLLLGKQSLSIEDTLMICDKVSTLKSKLPQRMDIKQITGLLRQVEGENRLFIVDCLIREPLLVELLQMLHANQAALKQFAELLVDDPSKSSRDLFNIFYKIGSDKKQLAVLHYIVAEAQTIWPELGRQEIIEIACEHREAHRIFEVYQAALQNQEKNKASLLLRIGKCKVLGTQLGKALKIIQQHPDANFAEVSPSLVGNDLMSYIERKYKLATTPAQPAKIPTSTLRSGEDWKSKLQVEIPSVQPQVTATALKQAISQLQTRNEGRLRQVWAECPNNLAAFLRHLTEFHATLSFMAVLDSHHLFQLYLQQLPENSASLEGVFRDKSLSAETNLYRTLMHRLQLDRPRETLDELAVVKLAEAEHAGFLKQFRTVIILGGTFDSAAASSIESCFPDVRIECYSRRTRPPLRRIFGKDELVIWMTADNSHSEYYYFKKRAVSAGATFRQFSGGAGASAIIALLHRMNQTYSQAQ